MKKLLITAFFLLRLASYIGVGLLHLWTVYIAFIVGRGFIAAAITFFLPVLSEMFWFGAMWNKFGFINWFTLACLCCLFLYNFMSAVGSLMTGYEQKEAA